MAMTGLAISSMSVVRQIKAIRQSQVTSITDTENTAMKTENTQEVLLIFMRLWNKQASKRQELTVLDTSWGFN